MAGLQQNWANEFINFGQLITVTPMEEKFNISVNTSQDSPSQPTLCLEPLQMGKNISTIDTWTSALQIFVGIYTSKFPAEAQARPYEVWGGGARLGRKRGKLDLL